MEMLLSEHAGVQSAKERNGVHTEAALQLLANPHGLRGFL
jgi:hypothetical protein